MSSIMATIGFTIVKLAVLGGVSFTVINGVEWFHTTKKDFKKGGRAQNDHDVDDFRKSIRATR